MSRMWSPLFLILLLMFGICQAQDDCTKVDYSSELGPVRDQGETGWCFAYTAADMLTQKLRRSDPVRFGQKQVSALDVTFQYLRNRVDPIVIPRTDSAYWKQKIHQRSLQKLEFRAKDIAQNPTLDNFHGGFIDIAIHAYRNDELGVCTETDLPSEKGMTKEVMSAVNQKYYDLTLKCGPDNFNSRNLVEIRNKCWEEVIQRKCHRQKSGIRKMVNSFDTGIFGSDSLADGSFVFFTQDPQGNREDTTEKVRQSLRETLNKGLNQGSVVGIDFSPAFLMNEVAKANMLKEHARHGVSVVAREKVNNQCFYKIRNSWGRTCKMYNATFQTRCKDGSIWVSESELLPNIFRAQYLE